MLIVESGTVRKETYAEWRERMDAKFEAQVAERRRLEEAEESQRRARTRPKPTTKTRTATHGVAQPRKTTKGRTLTRVEHGQQCAGGCGWRLVPNGQAPPEGHRQHVGRGMCNTCFRRSVRGSQPRRKRPANCERCGIRIVGRNEPRPEGTRRYGGHGLCTTCHKAWQEGRA